MKLEEAKAIAKEHSEALFSMIKGAGILSVLGNVSYQKDPDLKKATEALVKMFVTDDLGVSKGSKVVVRNICELLETAQTNQDKKNVVALYLKENLVGEAEEEEVPEPPKKRRGRSKATKEETENAEESS